MTNALPSVNNSMENLKIESVEPIKGPLPMQSVGSGTLLGASEYSELCRDRQRLNWLESRLCSSYLELCHYGNRSQLDGEPASLFDSAKPFYVGGQYGHSGASLRAAIDASMSDA